MATVAIISIVTGLVMSLGGEYIRQQLTQSTGRFATPTPTISGISWSVTYKIANYVINLKGTGNNPIFDILRDSDIFKIMGTVPVVPTVSIDARLQPLVDALARGEITSEQVDAIIASASSAVSSVVSTPQPSVSVVAPPTLSAQPYVCDICDASYASQEYLDKHLLAVHGVEPYRLPTGKGGRTEI